MNTKGEALMTKRKLDRLRPGMWEWPGGKVEPGETDAAALTREWCEELGLAPSDIKVVRRLCSKDFDLEVAFTITLYRVELAPSADPRPPDADDLRWVLPLDAVQHLPCVASTYEFYRIVKGLVAPAVPAVPVGPTVGGKPRRI